MQTLLIIIIVIIAVILIAILLRYLLPHTISGGASKTYYHGSKHKINNYYLEPRPSFVIDGEEAVFASDIKDIAITFIPKWSDDDFSLGHWNDEKRYNLIEIYPGAFEKKIAGTSGYLYSVSADDFYHDKRLGMRNEFIAKNKQKILNTEYIPDVYNYLKKSKQVKLIPYNSARAKEFRKWSKKN